MATRILKRFRRLSEKDKKVYLYIKNIFGFRPGNIFLFKQALRHKSAANIISQGVKDSNERLEYLGDALLSAIIADYLFKKYPLKDEGFLTETRSKIVSRANLNKLARKIDLQKNLETSPELARNTSNAILGDAFEALIGAIYLDRGYDFTRRTVIKYLIELHLNVDELVNTEVNFKSKIIEWSQKERREVEFKLLEEINLPRNQRQYKIEVLIDGEHYAEAIDFSIKSAEQRGSEIALQKLDL